MYKDDENNKIQYYDYNDIHNVNELINDEEDSNHINLVLKERVNPWYFDTNIINTKNKQFKITGFEEEIKNNIDVNIEKKTNNNYIFYIMFFIFIIIILIVLIKLKT
jgi:ATP-dependent Zn protease